MKKLFTYLLISSMVVLSSCTNYDDQFDDLNSQLSTLKTQIDGFTALSSGVTALQGTVSSLQAAVALLPKTATPATDISGLQTALTALAATVAELKTSLAGAATSAEVATLAANLATAQTDLSELLAANNVYSTDLVINSAATLEFAKSLGDKLTMVNANVTFDVDATMNIADVQIVANKFVTIVKDLAYYATSSTVAAVTFDNLTSTGDISIAQAGSYVLPKLSNATDIYLGSNYSSKVAIVDLRSLAKVTSLNTSTILAASVAGQTPATNTAHTVSFSQATEIHLTAIPYYGAGLTILGKDGSVLDLTAFASVDVDGDETNYALSITGPASLSLTKYTKGAFSATDVTSVTLSGHRGSVTLNGVANFTHDKLAGALTITGTSDLKTVNITGALDNDVLLTGTSVDITPPSVSFSGQTALLSATLAGKFVAANFTGATNISSLTSTAQVTTFTLSGNNDLTTLSVAGKVNTMVLTGADDLLAAAFTYSTYTEATANPTILKSGSLSVTSNPKLESLTSSADKLASLTITGNAKLTTLDFTGLATIGGLTTAVVAINSNGLNATKIVDTYNTGTLTAATDTGAFTSTSGLKTLSTYLAAAAAAPGTSGVKAYFDTADLHVKEGATSAANVEQNSLKYTVSGDIEELTVVDITASVTTTSGSTVRQRITNVWDLNRDAVYNNSALATGEGVSIGITNGVTKTFVGSATVTTAAALVAAINADTTSFGSDVTVTAGLDAYATSYNKISYTTSAGAAATTNSTGTIYWAYGTATGTAVIGSGSSTAQIATALAAAVTSVAGYNASASGNAVVITALVTNTQNLNLGTGVSFANTLAITELGSTTVQWSSNTSNAAGQDSDYFISVSKFDTKGLRVTVQNNSTSVAMAATVTAVAPGTGIASLVPTTLASGTNMVGNFTYVAAFSDVDTASSSTVAGNTTNRTAWL